LIRRRLAAALVLVAPAVACVDLFHSTDFETLCTKSPPDPSCGPVVDGAVEASDGEAGPKPHPDFCKWNATEAQTNAERACAFIGACEGPLDSMRFGPCVAAARLVYDCQASRGRRAAGDVDELWGCLSQVTSCGDVDACLFPGGAVPPCPAVNAGESFTACSGSVRVQCASTTAGRPTSIEPCLAGAQTCTAITKSFSQCTGVGGKACTAAKCSDTSAVVCGTGSSAAIDVGRDCAKLGGGTCVTTDAGPACSASSDSIACEGGYPRCDRITFDDLSKACINSREITIDCRAVNAHCIADSGSPTTPEQSCTVPPTGQSCSGDDTCTLGKLVSCASGIKHELDCTSVGLGPCALRPDGYAHCNAP